MKIIIGITLVTALFLSCSGNNNSCENYLSKNRDCSSLKGKEEIKCRQEGEMNYKKWKLELLKSNLSDEEIAKTIRNCRSEGTNEEIITINK